ncbi:hypothetical protein M0G74_12055 [Microbulbifer sp. CAU 1566]|uniref:hypothetical protein n=1 Tax=Microbulbifer sp. CAU 1566 TaxID=2933269 RepID=UPI002004C3C3|nr:hypothetical protein [Microbulbifer sp. CAU 1566]MCK7598007.1 hypothetical protein [Microbulbifer sp. CAU 1566]
MRIFVLTTGRSGSTTFEEACTHIDGMTSGHEIHAGMIEGRLQYPDNHIESDNRLVWFLGTLDRIYDDKDTFYVHLTRDHDKIARSYRDRWQGAICIARHFYHGTLMCRRKPDMAQALQACRLMVDTVADNVTFFLSRRQNWVEVRMEHLEEDFFKFMDAAGLKGDRDKILGALRTVKSGNKYARKKKSLLYKFRSLYSSRFLR